MLGRVTTLEGNASWVFPDGLLHFLSPSGVHFQEIK